MKEGFSFNFDEKAYKKCTGECQRSLLISRFSKNSTKKDGLCGECKDCDKVERCSKEKRAARQLKYIQKPDVKKVRAAIQRKRMEDPEYKKQYNLKQKEKATLRREKAKLESIDGVRIPKNP